MRNNCRCHTSKWPEAYPLYRQLVLKITDTIYRFEFVVSSFLIAMVESLRKFKTSTFLQCHPKITHKPVYLAIFYRVLMNVIFALLAKVFGRYGPSSLKIRSYFYSSEI